MSNHRCRHLNGDFREYQESYYSVLVQGGIIQNDTGLQDNSGNIVYYEYECFDCRRTFKFKEKSKLKWLRKIYWQTKFLKNE
jgi:hypothetical protein